MYALRTYDRSTTAQSRRTTASRTIFTEIQQSLVEHLNVFRVPLKRDGVAGFRVPRTDRQQTAIVILRHQVVEYRAVVDESIQLTAIIITRSFVRKSGYHTTPPFTYLQIKRNFAHNDHHRRTYIVIKWNNTCLEIS